MAGYTISSEKGKNIANNMKSGDTYKASDGSTWKKNGDGSVSVTTKNGGVTQNALGGSSGNSGNSGGNKSGGGSNSNGGSSSRTPVVIYAPDGTASSGYIQNNMTYNADGSRIGNGSTVQAANGKFYQMTANGGVEVSGPQASVAPPNQWAIDDTAVQQKPILTGDQIANMYGVTYDYNTILDKLSKAVDSKYVTLENDYKQNENTFYDSLYGLQNDALTNLRANRGNAVSNGASAGIASANELLTMLGLGQQSSTLATTLAQEKQQLSDKKVADQELAKTNALTFANQAGVNLGNLASQFNAADTQFSVGAMDAIARIQQANAELAASNNYATSGNNYTGSKSYTPSANQSGTKTQYGSIDEMVKADDFWSWASTMGLSTNLAEATKQWNALGKYTPAQQYAAQQKAREGTIEANKDRPTDQYNGDPNSPSTPSSTTGVMTDRQGRKYKYVNGRIVYITPDRN